MPPTTMMALVGLKSSDDTKSSHATFLESQLIPLLQKIQRELVWRRFTAAKVMISNSAANFLGSHMFLGMPNSAARSHPRLS
jgi:hypothetical protein